MEQRGESTLRPTPRGPKIRSRCLLPGHAGLSSERMCPTSWSPTSRSRCHHSSSRQWQRALRCIRPSNRTQPSEGPTCQPCWTQSGRPPSPASWTPCVGQSERSGRSPLLRWFRSSGIADRGQDSDDDHVQPDEGQALFDVPDFRKSLDQAFLVDMAIRPIARVPANGGLGLPQIWRLKETPSAPGLTP